MTYLWVYFKEGEKMKNVEKIKPTGLFTNYIYKAIPLVFDESMSYYETLCGLLSYLKDTVIPALNNNADAIIEVQSLMTQLQDYVDNYFKNLDVQQEINNKLDAMVASGTLQEIIANYLNSKAIFGFDNVASMKQATNLINGSYAKTLGFYNKNDGGMSTYKIREITNNDVVDESFIIALNNDNLIAEYISVNEYNLCGLGCYGDGTHDDTTTIKTIIDKAKDTNSKITSPKNKTYLISETLDISNLFIDLNEATIKANMADDILSIDTQNYYGKLINATINCNKIATTGIHIIYARKHDFININIIDVNNIAIKSESGYENYFYNLHIDGSDTATNTTGLYLTSSDSQYAKIIMRDMTTGIHAINCFNNYNNIHSWISRQDLVPNSSYIKAKGGRMILTDCYSDTCQYCFNIYDIPCTIMNSNMNYYNNVGVYTPEIASTNIPYFLYSSVNSASNYITNVNCMFTGYSSSIKTLLSNQSYFNGELVNCSITNFDHTLAYSSTDVTNSEATQTITNNLTKISKIVTLELYVKVNITSEKSNFNLGSIPTYFRTSKEIITMASYGTTQYNTEGVCNIFLNHSNGNILASFPSGTSTGDKYIKIYMQYIGKLES